MRIKVYIFVVLVLALLMGFLAAEGWADHSPEHEYQVKAAFLYNFVKFVDWPAEKIRDDDEPIIIGIIGKDPFGEAFDPIKGKKVKDKSIVIKRFKDFEGFKKANEADKSKSASKIEDLRKCHVLFICSSEKKNLSEIINSVKNDGVLTVSKMKGFLESGGIVNFLMEEKNVRFEINKAAAEKAGLKARSKLLRLAKRVVEEKSSGEAES